MRPELGPRRSAFASIALVACVYVVTLASIEREGLWITDNANKLLQMQALIASGYTDASLPWPGRPIDPSLTMNPLPAPFSHVEQGQLHSQYPPFFAAISSLPYRALGIDGLYLLPLLASFLALAGVSRLAGALGLSVGGRHAAVLLTGLCTPVWFYAVVFWEHALAVCLCIWAIHGLLEYLRTRAHAALVRAVALSTFAIYFREELVLLLVLLVAVAALETRPQVWRVATLAAATAAALLLPLLGLQAWWTGNALGHHVGSNLTELSGHLSSRAVVVYKLLMAAGPSVALSTLLTLPFVTLFFWNPRLTTSRFRLLLPVGAAVSGLVGAFVLAGFREDPIVYLLKSNSLFPAAPILMLALMRREDDDPLPARLVSRIVMIFSLGYAVAAPEISAGGIHWGNRFLILAYPLLAVLAARNLTGWFSLPAPRARWAVAAIASTIVVSLAAQAYSIRLLDTKKTFSRRANAFVAGSAEQVLVTDVWWVPQELFSTFYDRPIFLVRSSPQLTVLKNELRAGGHASFLFVGGARGRSPQANVIDDGGLGFFSLAVTSRSTRAGPGR